MKRTSSGGCGSVLLLLFLVFFLLKVTGAVTWSWWWVTSPLWLPIALVVIALAVMAVMGVSAYKMVVAGLRKQESGRTSSRAKDMPEGDILDVEGTEVADSSPVTPTWRESVSLPAATDAQSGEGDDRPEAT